MKVVTFFFSMILALAGSLCAQDGAPGVTGGNAGRRAKLAGEQQMRQHRASVDVGDFYNTPHGRRSLRRSLDRIVIRGENLATARENVTAARGKIARLADAEEVLWGGERIILKMRKDTAEAQDAPRTLLANIRENSGLPVDPVFVDPDSGLLMVAESQIIICLAADVDAKDFFAGDKRPVMTMAGTKDQFIVTVEGATAEDILAECVRLSRLAGVTWAEPNFRCEGVKQYTPNDTNFTDQWHLLDSAPGSVAAQTAWDLVKGDDIVIAIIDDGVQTTHPDLQANIAAGKTNVLTGTTNVEPADPADSHGTAVAGVAAAIGNNALGVAGVAFKSKILPVKMATGSTYATDAQLATAFRYAAGLTGGPGWQGADVINFSWSWVESSTLNSALVAATTTGRGGRGCPVFAAAGNGAADWFYYSFPVVSGSHTFKFEYKKNPTVSEGQDCIWIDDVYLPGVGTQGFEGGAFPPSGWTTGGSANWFQNTQPEWVHGAGADGTRSAQSGNIGDLQTTWLQTVQTTATGDMAVYVLTSSEEDYDVFNLYIDGVWQKPFGAETTYTDPGGIYTLSEISYPANHPNAIAVGASTDGNLRADYSQFGTGLDFVTPSGGGDLGIWTTDRTGPAGYDDSSYTAYFSGTSSSTPLASGIGALVLARNSTLAAAEVRSVLRRSCSKIGGVSYAGGDAGAGGWNKYYGYGKLMASSAVQNAAGGALQFGSATYSVAENGGTVTITATRTGGSAGAVNVSYATANGTATAGSDYTARSGTLAWPDGDTANKTFTVTILNDAVIEAGETFTVTLSSPSGATLGTPATTTVTILSDTPLPTVQFGSASYAVAENGGTVTITATRTGGSVGAVNVSYATANGTATAGSDYTARSGTLAWADGDTANKTLTVTILNDAAYEAGEMFTVTLSSPSGATLGTPATTTVTITNDDPLPTVQFGSATYSMAENGGTVTITAKRTGGSAGAVSVNYATANGTATAGSDYSATSGTLAWPDGDTADKTFTVPILSDAVSEANESFTVTLSSPSGATLGTPATTTVTITNEVLLPTIQFGAATYSVAENGGTATITAKRTGGSAGAVSVNYATAAGSATAGSDYVVKSGTLNWSSGDVASKTFTVTIMDNSNSEGHETFAVNLSGAVGASLGSPATTTVIIYDNDSSHISFSQEVYFTYSGSAYWAMIRDYTHGVTESSTAAYGGFVSFDCILDYYCDKWDVQVAYLYDSGLGRYTEAIALRNYLLY